MTNCACCGEPAAHDLGKNPIDGYPLWSKPEYQTFPELSGAMTGLLIAPNTSLIAKVALAELMLVKHWSVELVSLLVQRCRMHRRSGIRC